jgi:hypothetical protein
LALVKVGQPDDRQPEYVEAFRDSSRLVCFASPETVRPGRDLIVTRRGTQHPPTWGKDVFNARNVSAARTLNMLFACLYCRFWTAGKSRFGDLAAVAALGSASVLPTH